MDMMNPVDRDVQTVFKNRWSPYVYDPARDVERADLEALFEAARWTMSAFNAQPWRYIVGVRSRTPEAWGRVHDSLLEGNQGWARNAPVLALGLAETHYAHNGEPNGTAFHDLGAASAALTFEATARGLVVHQMAGINPQKARELFDLPDGLQPFTALAVGYPGNLDEADEGLAQRDHRVRERKPVEELVIRGGF